MAGPGGWRDKEVTDLGHLPVSRGRPSPPKCSLLRVLSIDGGDRRPKAWLGQDFDKTATAGGGPGSGLAGKAPPGYPGCSKLTERQRAGGRGMVGRGGSRLVRATNSGTCSKCGPFGLAALGYLS